MEKVKGIQKMNLNNGDKELINIDSEEVNEDTRRKRRRSSASS